MKKQTLQQVRTKLANAKRGVYHHMEWKSETIINGITYTKVSKGSVRFINYYKKTGKPQPSTYQDIIIRVNKQGEEYAQFFTTGKAPQVKYYRNNRAITKANYDKNVQPKPSQVDLMFSKHLTDIIAFR